MSNKRHRILFDPQGETGAQMTTLAYDYRGGHEVPEHFHREDQLVFARQGVMTVRAQKSLWVVPPQRAVWIPGGAAHSIRMSGAVSMRTLYFAPGVARGVPAHCFVVNVPPLLRELILHACNQRKHTTRQGRDQRLVGIILDLLADAQSVPLQLPAPADARARKVADRLMADPRDPASLEQLCRQCGGSKRTIERVFVEQTGLTFGKWRQQLRLLHAIQRLAAGDKVAAVAFDSGYRSTSAFISVFRKSFGVTPRHFIGDAP